MVANTIENEALKENVLAIINYSIWGGSLPNADWDIYEELKRQAIVALPASVLSDLSLPPDLYHKWQTSILHQLVYYTQYKHVQAELPITVPFVVLKGTSAAQYYPYPEYRAMGDIDILTRREDFGLACQELLDNGYRIKKQLDREVGLTKNGIMVELHRYFASLNEPEQAEYVDNLIITNIGPNHVLPDHINGLVLLEHISQHLENGLGLRQIIDWMMFVDKCLPDEKWPEFYQMADRVGLSRLAIVVTRMCEMYLGLPTRKWCEEGREETCRQLMEYVISCGNFGNKINDSDTNRSIHTMYKIHSLKSFFELLQNSGIHNWELAQRNPIIRKIAWLFQIGDYAVKAFGRRGAFVKLRSEYRAVQERKQLFEDLGVKQLSKGIAVYQDGRYRIK